MRFMQNANLVINHLDRKQSLVFLQDRARTMAQLTQELGLKF